MSEQPEIDYRISPDNNRYLQWSRERALAEAKSDQRRQEVERSVKKNIIDRSINWFFNLIAPGLPKVTVNIHNNGNEIYKSHSTRTLEVSYIHKRYVESLNYFNVNICTCEEGDNNTKIYLECNGTILNSFLFPDKYVDYGIDQIIHEYTYFQDYYDAKIDEALQKPRLSSEISSHDRPK